MKKRIICIMLMVCIIITSTSLPNTLAVASESDMQEAKEVVQAGDKILFQGGTIEITYKVTAVWYYSYNIDVTVQNKGNEKIHNWALLMYLDDNEITNIWNAKIAKKEDGVYLLDNNDWNMDIPLGSSVNFGFTASYEDSNIFLPKSFALTNCEKDVPANEYRISYKVNSKGGGQLTAEMAISNLSDHTIEDWSLYFQYENAINNVWCANMESKEPVKDGYSYYFRNPGWAQNIVAEDSYAFGFQAVLKNIDAIPEQFKMKCYDNSIDYEADSDADGVNDVSEIMCGSNPYSEDTDGDGLNDAIELFQLGLNPLKVDTDDNGISDGEEDTDNDQLSNLFELKNGLEPWSNDTDGDGLLDGEELKQYNTDPKEEDTDGDTLLDGTEIKLDFSPIKKDTDANGITDDKELVRQKLTEKIEEDTNDGAITKVTVDMAVTGDMDEHTTIENVYEEDMLSRDVEGLVGVPVRIESGGHFEKATITFAYDAEKLNDTSEDDLAVMWYDEENDDYVIYDDESVLDKQNHTISYTTTHFSTYLVVNKKKWYKVWENEINYRTPNKNKEYVDVVFTVDASGSMKGTEIKHAKKALKEFVAAKRGKDRCSVIQFTDEAEVLGGFKKSKKKIKQDIDEIDAGGKTDVDAGLNKAIKQYTKSSYNDVGNSKNILLICDGDLDYNQKIVDKAIANDISIYTVLVGGNNDADLRKISKNTGGEFCLAKNASDLSNIIFHIEDSIMGSIDTTDSDGDGICDVFEKKGMMSPNGKIIKTDAHSKDTDGDGLSDYREMTGRSYKSVPIIPGRKRVYKKGTDEYIDALCFSYKSNPQKLDSDGDEYNDKVDKRPLEKDVILYGIKKNKSFVPVWQGGKGSLWLEQWDSKDVAYGGNQGWWKKKNKKFETSGCGIIAASNVLIYQNRKGKKLSLPIQKSSYMSNTDELKNYIYYMPFIGGTTGINIHNGIEKYARGHRLEYVVNLETSIFSKKKRDKTKTKIMKACKKKNPIILSVGPKALGTVDEDNRVTMKKYSNSLVYFVGSTKLYDHYVTVTGVVENKHNNTLKFQVSSWGEKYYVDYDEICRYVDKYGTDWTCDAVFVEKK